MQSKFDNALMRHEPEETIEQLIEARDEFAIRFAEWSHKEGRFIQKDLTQKELLEIFKKENPTY